MSAEKRIERKQISCKAAGGKKFRGTLPQGEGITKSTIAKREEFLKLLNDLKKVGKGHIPPWLDMEGGKCKISELVRLSEKLVNLVKKMGPDDAKWALGEVENTQIQYFDLHGCVAHHLANRERHDVREVRNQ